MARPRTAATTSIYDESRIKDKIQYLDEVEQRITADIESIKADRNFGKKPDENVPVTKKMILESAMCDTLDQVGTIMLRDRKIVHFDDNNSSKTEDKFKMNDLCNVECLFASHNMISELFGIFQLVTLRELNLSFNRIIDVSGIEELTQL